MYYKYVLIVVKIVLDFFEEELIQVVDSLVCYNIDGVIVINIIFDCFFV